MHDHSHEQPLPQALLLSVAALIVFVLIATAVVRISGIGAATINITAEKIESYDLVFADRKDGAVVVSRHPDGQLLDTLPPGSNGFIRGVLRGLSRERIRHAVDLQSPFRLTRWSDGRLTLQDSSNDKIIPLEAFGVTNVDAFARLLALAKIDI